jgi:hypothetical protein
VESGDFQGYVRSLGQIIKSTHSDLKESIDLFQEVCHRVSPDSVVPMAIITAVRQTYKGIQDQLTNAPWLSIFPGLAIFFSVFSFNQIADGLRDISDPKLRG